MSGAGVSLDGGPSLPEPKVAPRVTAVSSTLFQGFPNVVHNERSSVSCIICSGSIATGARLVVGAFNLKLWGSWTWKFVIVH